MSSGKKGNASKLSKMNQNLRLMIRGIKNDYNKMEEIAKKYATPKVTISVANITHCLALC